MWCWVLVSRLVRFLVCIWRWMYWCLLVLLRLVSILCSILCNLILSRFGWSVVVRV